MIHDILFVAHVTIVVSTFLRFSMLSLQELLHDCFAIWSVRNVREYRLADVHVQPRWPTAYSVSLNEDWSSWKHVLVEVRRGRKCRRILLGRILALLMLALSMLARPRLETYIEVIPVLLVGEVGLGLPS